LIQLKSYVYVIFDHFLATVPRRRIGIKQLQEHGPGVIPYRFIDTVTDTGSFNLSLDDTGGFQLLQMLGDGGLCKADHIHQVIDDTGPRFNQVLDDFQPGWMGECLGQGGGLIQFIRENIGSCNPHVICLMLYRNITI
jgi:hypothetical protein